MKFLDLNQNPDGLICNVRNRKETCSPYGKQFISEGEIVYNLLDRSTFFYSIYCIETYWLMMVKPYRISLMVFKRNIQHCLWETFLEQYVSPKRDKNRISNL